MLNSKFNLKKSFIMVVIVSCLLVMSAGNVLAGSFYVDYMQGSWDNEDNDDDASAAIVGFEQNFDRFKLSLEYTDSEWKNGDCIEFTSGSVDYIGYSDYDFTGFDVKFGYQLTNQIAFMIGYHKYDLKPQKNSFYTEYFDDCTIDGITLGFDANFPISDKLSINGSLSYGIDGKYKRNYYDSVDDENYSYSIDVNATTAKVKFNFALTSNLDVSLGYRYTVYKPDEGNGELTFFGPTAGLTYRFGTSYTDNKSTTATNRPGTKTLIFKNDFHGTEYTLTVAHTGKIKVGDVINLTAEQIEEVKKTLCGSYPSPFDGELGVRETMWHKLGNKEVKVKELVMYDRNGQIVGASLTVTEVR
jgi:hypothetical protein